MGYIYSWVLYKETETAILSEQEVRSTRFAIQPHTVDFPWPGIFPLKWNSGDGEFFPRQLWTTADCTNGCQHSCFLSIRAWVPLFGIILSGIASMFSSLFPHFWECKRRSQDDESSEKLCIHATKYTFLYLSCFVSLTDSYSLSVLTQLFWGRNNFCFLVQSQSVDVTCLERGRVGWDVWVQPPAPPTSAQQSLDVTGLCLPAHTLHEVTLPPNYAPCLAPGPHLPQM